ncbi:MULTISPECIES: carbohydrate ABC transporter permease [Halomicrobium]|uniref:Binding-protein-dependent transport systems inner membrane component n=2 Tax=Halomicrobium mukohataei TaxID=57705 RepID=C7P4B5_HALMD|nr:MULTISPECIES: sugar ABC transporter permease [Halomicrobium]ACV47937.1 binding-protein-dependent transport systems inner membrane component [Halomicrobium mukohataei DSM 12286]QCD66374.1 sugar ABC transporter permease [Halomicrobium mukohataei]QFR21179.1 ABC transporter permease subunit [Halomicrobium sp. ZPS1]
MASHNDDTEESGDAVTDGGVVEEQRQTGFGPITRLNERFGSDFVESSQFWLPPFLLVGLFVYGAIIWNVMISLTDFRGFGTPDYSDLDLEMYARALSDSGFVDAAVNTFVLLIGFTLVTLAIGLGLAILIDRNIRFENTFRTIYLLPMSLSFVVTAQFWAWMYNFNNGVINIVLTSVGLDRVDWIGSPNIVLWAVVFALMWQFAGYAMVVYLAGLRAIPDEHYEAAKVDGASTLRMYWRVIIPQLKGSTISASVVLMVFALKAFDFLYSLVGGYRPPNGADILATKMVREAYANLNWAYSSAIAIMLFLMALSIVGPYLYYQYKEGHL